MEHQQQTLQASSGTTVTRNVGWLLLGSTANKVFFLAATVIIARYLGTAGYGIYAFATFFSFIFATLADGGLQIVLVRETARDKNRANRYFGTVLLLKCGMTLLALLLLSCAVILMDLSPIQVRTVFVAMGAYLALSYGNTALAICRAFERMAFEGVVLALQGLVFVILIVIGVTTQADVLQLVGSLLIACVISAILAYYWALTRFAKPRFKLNIQLVRFLFKEAWPIGVSLFLFIFYGRIGTIALETMQGSAEAGTYSAAYSLINNLRFVPIALTAAILPAFSQSAVSHPHRFGTLCATSFKVMLLLGLPLAVSSMFLAEPIIHLLYGSEFGDAVAVLRIIIWSVVFSFLSMVFRTTLESTNRQARWTWALIIGVGVNLLLNVLLIPRSGTIGASWALLAADVLIFVAALVFVLKELPWLASDLAKVGLLTSVSAVFMGLTLRLLEGQHPVVAILAAGLAYLLSLVAFRVVNKEDLSLLTKTFRIGRVKPDRCRESDNQ